MQYSVITLAKSDENITSRHEDRKTPEKPPPPFECCEVFVVVDIFLVVFMGFTLNF